MTHIKSQHLCRLLSFTLLLATLGCDKKYDPKFYAGDGIATSHSRGGRIELPSFDLTQSEPTGRKFSVSNGPEAYATVVLSLNCNVDDAKLLFEGNTIDIIAYTGAGKVDSDIVWVGNGSIGDAFRVQAEGSRSLLVFQGAGFKMRDGIDYTLQIRYTPHPPKADSGDTSRVVTTLVLEHD
jgi:hypothetical protein